MVTGGAGFIGSHLVDRLISEDFDVVVLDDFSGSSRENLSSHLGQSNFCLVEVDVRDRAYVKRIYGTKPSWRMFKFSAVKSIVDEASFVG